MENSSLPLGCSPTADAAFGPIVHSCRSDFDFTITFEQYFFTLVPASALLIAAPFRLRHLSKRPATVAGNPLRLIKLTATILFAAFQLSLAILWTTQPPQLGGLRTTSIAASFVSFASGLMLCALSYTEHTRSLRPSLLLNAYLLLSALLDVAVLRTFWMAAVSTPIRALFTVSFSLKLVVLVLEAKEKGKYLRHGVQLGSPEVTAGLYSQGFFWWLNPLLTTGFRRLLKPHDLYTLEEEMASELLNRRFWHAWDNAATYRRHKLIRVCLVALKWPILSVVGPRLVLLAFTILQPLLLNSLLNFLQDPTASINIGYGLLGAYGLVYLGITLSSSFYSYQNFRFVTMLRGTLVSAVFSRSTNIIITTNDNAKPVTLMSTDVDAILRAVRELHDFWASVLQIALASWLLSNQIGFAAVGPIVVCLLSLLATLFLAPYSKKYMLAWVGKIQKRVGITSSVMGHMKSIKMSGLGPQLSSTISTLRRDEVDTAKPTRILGAVMSALAQVPKLISPVAGFALFSVVALRSGETLGITRMFSSLSLVILLGSPLFSMFEMVVDITAAMGCFARIEKFLTENTKADTTPLSLPQTPRESAQNDGPGGSTAQLSPQAETFEMRSFDQFSGAAVPSASRAGAGVDIELQDVSFSWTKESQPVVKNVSLSVEAGQFVMIVGPVGSGKSTFLTGLLEEIPSSGGPVLVSKTKRALCEQTPWLINDTIKKNIIGYAHFDPELYQQVVRACDLERDFAQLENGDETKVGSKGAALSGGQKQRVAIARAVYSRPQIAFFDDVFSGLDNQTSRTVFRNVFSKKDGLLRQWGTTVVLATQAVKYIPSADLVLALSKDGEVLEQGRPTDLLKSDSGTVKAMVGEHQSAAELENDEAAAGEGIQTPEDPEAPKKKASAPKPEAPEDKRRQTGDFSVYGYYFSHVGRPFTVAFLVVEVLWAFLSTFPTVWLNWWAEANADNANTRVGYYLGGYTGLQVAGVLSFGIMVWFGIVVMAGRAGVRLHQVLLDTVMRAPISLFTSTDIGSIITRFSQDIGLLDRSLPLGLVVGTTNLFTIAGMAVLIALATGYVAASFPLLAAVFYYLQMGYLRTSRQLRFLDLEEKAPVYTQFLETLSGLATIRAFGWTAQAKELNHQLVDKSQRPYYLLLMIQQWLTLVLDLVVTGLAMLVVGLAIRLRDSVSVGLTGVSLVQLITFAETIKVFIQFWASLETSIGAVSRIRDYSQTIRDENLPGEGAHGPVPPSWPSRGKVEIKNISAAYEPNGHTVTGGSTEGAVIQALDGISLSFAPGEKIGICGRTGSGKSSLLLALVRLLDLSSGSITIDDVDLSTVRREEVRSGLIAITQDHFALPGSVRDNLDPYRAAVSTDAIAAVLEKVGLWAAIQEKGGLDAAFGDDVLSHGQRQLFSLARAILRKDVGRVVLLDEATSSVDNQTDALMQRLIWDEFREHTVISIAHRLETIADFDRVVVLDQGCVVENGPPGELLAAGGRFKELWDVSRGGQARGGGAEEVSSS